MWANALEPPKKPNPKISKDFIETESESVMDDLFDAIMWDQEPDNADLFIDDYDQEDFDPDFLKMSRKDTSQAIYREIA